MLKNKDKRQNQTIIRCKYCNARLLLKDLMEEAYCEKAPDGSLVISCPECDGQFIEK